MQVVTLCHRRFGAGLTVVAFVAAGATAAEEACTLCVSATTRP
jgi:hypothetical protein